MKINCCVDRKVLTESSTGSSSSNKVRTMLSIQVETIDFDTHACVLRVKGRNVEENEYVKVCSVGRSCLLTFFIEELLIVGQHGSDNQQLKLIISSVIMICYMSGVWHLCFISVLSVFKIQVHTDSNPPSGYCLLFILLEPFC